MNISDMKFTGASNNSGDCLGELADNIRGGNVVINPGASYEIREEVIDVIQRELEKNLKW